MPEALVTIEVRDDGIAVITLDNPPVNALSQAVRSGLLKAVKTVGAKTSVAATVLRCAGRTFIAGADIREFDRPPAEPTFREMIDAIEAADKPVIAAIHGQALGGGLETALGCHYRVAVPGAKVGLPEVNLGLIPGAGGTQRLPRLAGFGVACDMITSGKPITAEKAADLGIIDRLIPGDLLDGAVEFAREVASADLGPRRLSARAIEGDGGFDFEARRLKLGQSRRGFEAPQRAVDALEAAATHPFEEGMALERELFMALKAGRQSAAQRHLFFAEREAGKVPGQDRDTRALPVAQVGVLGGGTMGAGIAMAFADSGLPVHLLEISEDALAAAMARIEGNYRTSVDRGRLTEADMADRLAAITPTADYGDLADVDLVVEAVFEDMAVKKQVFSELDRTCKPGCVLATNTSYLDVDEIARATGRPRDVLGLHFFSPANVMKLLEIVRGGETASEVLATGIRLARSLGKTGVVSGVGFGFIGNRMYQCYQREAGLLILEGVAPSRVDKALYDFGMPMGPFRLADLTGIDIGCAIRSTLAEADYEVRAFRVHQRLVDMGRKGEKTGAGFYAYPDGGRAPVEDEVTADVIREIAAEEGFTDRNIEDGEIVDRCILALVNEGARILEDGIAYRAGDIDVVFANGYGFPRYRGGPMHHAASLGFDVVLGRIGEFRERFGDRWWRSAAILDRAAETGTWPD